MKNFIATLLSMFVIGCTTAINLQKYDNDTANLETSKLIEKPYEVNGKWFFPYDYKELIEIGTATAITSLKSGDRTKNGEVFHQDVATGAHRSLGLASNIRVTNLDNGFSMLVRVNHRGAYSNTNIIELSDHVFDKLLIIKNKNIVKIELLNNNETFVLGEAKTYNAEKTIASKAPIDGVSVISIDSDEVNESIIIDSNIIKSQVNLNDFKIEKTDLIKNIYIHVATLSFEANAANLKNNLNTIENINVINSVINGKNNYKVVIGPFNNLSELSAVLNNDIIQQYEDLSIYLQ